MATPVYTTTELSNGTINSIKENSGFDITWIYLSSGITGFLVVICIAIFCICRKKNQPIPDKSDPIEEFWITEPNNDKTSYNVFHSEIEQNRFANTTRPNRIKSRPVSGPVVPFNWKDRTSNCHPKRVTFYDDDGDYMSMKGERVYILDAHLRCSFVSNRLSSWASIGELRRSCITNASGSYIDMRTLVQSSTTDVCDSLRNLDSNRQPLNVYQNNSEIRRS